MSSISSTQAGQGLLQYLQSLPGASAANSTASTAPVTSPSASSSAISTAVASGKTRGHHHHGDTSGFAKLLQTVTTALQSAQASGSTTDPNQTIESTLEKIFKNGIAGSTAGTSTKAAATPAETNATTDSAKQLFVDTLKSFGVTPEQFQQDLTTAFQQASGGQFNPSTAFASFPTGSLIDAVG